MTRASYSRSKTKQSTNQHMCHVSAREQTHVRFAVYPYDWTVACRCPGIEGNAKAYAGMNNKQYRRNFTPSDDALILEQPVTRVGLKTLATMLHTSQETLMRRADELRVSLAISDVHDGVVDTRALRRSDGLVDPLLERLKQVHGDQK